MSGAAVTDAELSDFPSTPPLQAACGAADEQADVHDAAAEQPQCGNTAVLSHLALVTAPTAAGDVAMQPSLTETTDQRSSCHAAAAAAAAAAPVAPAGEPELASEILQAAQAQQVDICAAAAPLADRAAPPASAAMSELATVPAFGSPVSHESDTAAASDAACADSHTLSLQPLGAKAAAPPASPLQACASPIQRQQSRPKSPLLRRSRDPSQEHLRDLLTDSPPQVGTKAGRRSPGSPARSPQGGAMTRPSPSKALSFAAAPEGQGSHSLLPHRQQPEQVSDPTNASGMPLPGGAAPELSSAHHQQRPKSPMQQPGRPAGSAAPGSASPRASPSGTMRRVQQPTASGPTSAPPAMVCANPFALCYLVSFCARRSAGQALRSFVCQEQCHLDVIPTMAHQCPNA